LRSTALKLRNIEKEYFFMNSEPWIKAAFSFEQRWQAEFWRRDLLALRELATINEIAQLAYPF